MEYKIDLTWDSEASVWVLQAMMCQGLSLSPALLML